ncbi:MAG: FixH family protein [Opitutaceae bacterium]|nr:FixH family protein [Cytophagales bacterium]
MKLSFPQYIIISFCVFIAFIVFLVIKTFSVNNELVTEDYYNQELKYQNKIDKMSHVTPELDLFWIQENDRLVLNYSQPFPENLKGEVEFYRPSDASKDLKFPLVLNKGGKQVFPKQLFSKGLYKIKADWKQNGQTFYTEKDIYIQ